jgi:hypothetical protein
VLHNDLFLYSVVGAGNRRRSFQGALYRGTASKDGNRRATSRIAAKMGCECFGEYEVFHVKASKLLVHVFTLPTGSDRFGFHAA